MTATRYASVFLVEMSFDGCNSSPHANLWSNALRKSALEPRFSAVVTQAIVVCYTEDTTLLKVALERECLRAIESRASYSEDELTYSRSYRCFMNHRSAWRLASESDGYTLICESDFVPCRGLGGFPTFWPLANPLAFGYLYQGSPRLLWASRHGHLRAHASPTVAYAVNARVAALLLEFFDEETRGRRPQDYLTFESHLQWWAMGRGIEAYMPARHYGEHGGFPQPEHRAAGVVTRVAHQADNLQGRLAFLPQYARGDVGALLRTRAHARLLGWVRLLSGRWIIRTDAYALRSSDIVRMYLIGLRRLLP